MKSSAPGAQPQGCRMGYVNTFQFDQLNMSHLCELRHRKKVFENCRKFISQERHIRLSKRLETGKLYIIKVASSKFSNPDSVRVNLMHHSNARF